MGKRFTWILFIFLFLSHHAFSGTEKYRLVVRGNPATSMTVAWTQNGGSDPMVHYDTVDHGTDWQAYSFQNGVDRSVSAKGMDNRFARLTGLEPNTAYYFVIRDSDGVSERFWFKTCPADKDVPLSIVAGGDSRTNPDIRRNANKLARKLRPHLIMFAGDHTDFDLGFEWQGWLDDWQLTIGEDGRMFPIIPTRGNHERSNSSIYDIFDVPSSDVYYASRVGNGLLKIYTLNSEIAIAGDQTDWLANELSSDSGITWKFSQYHRPMRPHVSSKDEQETMKQAWAPLFYEHDVRLVEECDAHTVKVTWPIVPDTNGVGDEGFVRNDSAGTLYLGEGCWGAPLRDNDDDKTWTRHSGKLNSFQWIHVKRDEICIRTVRTDNVDSVGTVKDSSYLTPPAGLEVWSPSGDSVICLEDQGPVTNRAEEPSIGSDLSVHPNPAKGRFELRLTGRTFGVKLFDMRGRVLLEKAPRRGRITIDAKAENLEPGIYMLRVRSAKGEQTSRRIVIE